MCICGAPILLGARFCAQLRAHARRRASDVAPDRVGRRRMTCPRCRRAARRASGVLPRVRRQGLDAGGTVRVRRWARAGRAARLVAAWWRCWSRQSARSPRPNDSRGRRDDRHGDRRFRDRSAADHRRGAGGTVRRRRLADGRGRLDDRARLASADRRPGSRRSRGHARRGRRSLTAGRPARLVALREPPPWVLDRVLGRLRERGRGDERARRVARGFARRQPCDGSCPDPPLPSRATATPDFVTRPKRRYTLPCDVRLRSFLA